MTARLLASLLLTFAAAASADAPGEYDLNGGSIHFSAPPGWNVIMQKTEGDPQVIAFQVRDPAEAGTEEATRVSVTTRKLDDAQVYSPEQVQRFSELFLAGAERDQLDAILDACVAVYKARLDQEQQVDFKGKAKVFCRTYDFLASVLPTTQPAWERLSILLNLLVAKLPAPQEEDLAKGILETIDMDSYRVEKRAAMKIALADEDAEIAPLPTDAAGRRPEAQLDRLSNILKAFNDHFGTLFTDADRVARRIRDDIAPKVAADQAYQNARDNTPHTARMAHDQALGKVMQILLKDDTQVYKQFVENESFRRTVRDMVYQLTSQGPMSPGNLPAT